jgi:hypothetical protein
MDHLLARRAISSAPLTVSTADSKKGAAGPNLK